MLRDNLVGLIVPMQSCGTQAPGDEFSYLENPRPIGAESSLTRRCSSPFQTEPRHGLIRKNSRTFSYPPLDETTNQENACCYYPDAQSPGKYTDGEHQQRGKHGHEPIELSTKTQWPRFPSFGTMRSRSALWRRPLMLAAVFPIWR